MIQLESIPMNMNEIPIRPLGLLGKNVRLLRSNTYPSSDNSEVSTAMRGTIKEISLAMMRQRDIQRDRVLTHSGEVAIKDAEYHYARNVTQTDHTQNKHAACKRSDYHQHGNTSVGRDKARRNTSDQVSGTHYYQLDFAWPVSTTVANAQ